METILYSLKNNADYSIDIHLALKYQGKYHLKNNIQNFVIEETKTNDNYDTNYNNDTTNENNDTTNENYNTTNNNNDTTNDNNGIFDKSLLDIYGNHTCILFEISKDVFQVRFLDKTSNKIIKRTEFYMQIPTLVEKLYTVIVIEKIEESNMEIVAIHSPPNNTSTVNDIITPSLK